MNGIVSQTLYIFYSCQLGCDSVRHITDNAQRHSLSADANAHHMKCISPAPLPKNTEWLSFLSRVECLLRHICFFSSSCSLSLLPCSLVLIAGCFTQAHSTTASSAKAPVDCTSCVTPSHASPMEWTSELSSAPSTTANPSGDGTTNGSHTPKWKVWEIFGPYCIHYEQKQMSH